jgi:small subunit ribosomal protein S3
MGQKIHPLGFRLGVSQAHASHWFAKGKQYSQLVVEDHFLRESIYTKFPNAGIDSIHIERQVDKIRIHICSARPRTLLGTSRQGVQSLREELTQKLKNYRQQQLLTNRESKAARGEFDLTNPLARISIHLTKLSSPDSSAAFLAEFIVEQLEKRIPFRRALKQAVQRAQRVSVKGIKVQVAGRLNGAEIARSEWVLKGQVPLHTLRAKMEYDSRTARTIYGLLGIKVWIFKGFDQI